MDGADLQRLLVDPRLGSMLCMRLPGSGCGSCAIPADLDRHACGNPIRLHPRPLYRCYHSKDAAGLWSPIRDGDGQRLLATAVAVGHVEPGAFALGRADGAIVLRFVLRADGQFAKPHGPQLATEGLTADGNAPGRPAASARHRQQQGLAPPRPALPTQHADRLSEAAVSPVPCHRSVYPARLR